MPVVSHSFPQEGQDKIHDRGHDELHEKKQPEIDLDVRVIICDERLRDDIQHQQQLRPEKDTTNEYLVFFLHQITTTDVSIPFNRSNSCLQERVVIAIPWMIPSCAFQARLQGLSRALSFDR